MGGWRAPRTTHASSEGRCSIGMLCGYSSGWLVGRHGSAHPEPSAMARSTVLVGATTINAILCLAARTAALYVPICRRG